MKIKSHGLIDNSGNIIKGSKNFSVQKESSGSYIPKFKRNVHKRTVVATARNLSYCDSSGTTMEVCNYQDERRKLGFSFKDEGDKLGFSFILI